MCNFMREILTTLYNEQRNTMTWDEDDQINEQAKRQLKNLTSVKQSFLISFFQIMLADQLQGVLSSSGMRDDHVDRQRTMIQYFIEIICLVNDKSLAKITFAFLFAKIDTMRSLYTNHQLSSQQSSSEHSGQITSYKP